MKKNIHPEYKDAEFVCACGNIIKTRSVRPGGTVEICSNCHSFFTGQQKFVDSGGRVERFNRRLKDSKTI
ncbi:MAG: 50S ribosomal protein L31 [Oscillospiraceae bacterium]|jgi:large subunit ribosomal protein L31|nr:50S ribosomal protein L31 [Oscillospiraceae bacterium]